MEKQLDDDEALLVVDIDGTLCDIKTAAQTYAELVPRADMVAKLREYQARGYRILLYTSRNMKTHNHNLGLINKHTAPVMLAWLAQWDIPYDEILFGKPWPRSKGFYIDDRAIRPDEFLKLSEQEIHQLLGQS
ncbi:capsule biosynthesis phosphatase [Duganella sp. CF517]|uniref:capsular biosynthesis protein n=1 Tax=Duganella sp. CF517 TaxID=1881038 RepID=UPI0008C4BC65|nr:capsular biosynthesis protein [Duganella sp. CF517]SEO20899.1 capsule biosynthesis phosphatase [Duganella sp. CF517]